MGIAPFASFLVPVVVLFTLPARTALASSAIGLTMFERMSVLKLEERLATSNSAKEESRDIPAVFNFFTTPDKPSMFLATLVGFEKAFCKLVANSFVLSSLRRKGSTGTPFLYRRAIIPSRTVKLPLPMRD